MNQKLISTSDVRLKETDNESELNSDDLVGPSGDPSTVITKSRSCLNPDLQKARTLSDEDILSLSQSSSNGAPTQGRNTAATDSNNDESLEVISEQSAPTSESQKKKPPALICQSEACPAPGTRVKLNLAQCLQKQDASRQFRAQLNEKRLVCQQLSGDDS